MISDVPGADLCLKCELEQSVTIRLDLDIFRSVCQLLTLSVEISLNEKLEVYISSEFCILYVNIDNKIFIKIDLFVFK